MAAQFHTLQIQEINKETEDCVSLTFKMPQELRSSFKYIQGQYLTLQANIFGEQVRRAYSLCSSPLDNEWQVAIKKVPQGTFSTFANDVLAVGDSLEVMPPLGKFYTDVDPKQKKHYLAFAAGSGITPILSILKTVLQAEPQSRFTLVYGNKGRQSIIFFEEIEALKNQHLNRLAIHHVFSREALDAEVNNGRIDAGKLQQLRNGLIDMNSVDEVFICGPATMTEILRKELPKLGLTDKQIHFELFASPDQEKGEKRSYEVAPEIAEKQAMVSVTLDGKTIDFPLSFGGENILDASLKHGADLPYACKGGVCSTCRAKLTEGEVDMEVNYALEEEEVKNGFILTCQSHPRTDKIAVDFDQQ